MADDHVTTTADEDRRVQRSRNTERVAALMQLHVLDIAMHIENNGTVFRIAAPKGRLQWRKRRR